MDYLLVSIMQGYSSLLVIYILLSWFPGARNSSFGKFLASICEPYIGGVRAIIPPIGRMDFSALFAYLLLQGAIAGAMTIMM